jgi:2-succinyl-5-enolpyruvyl-6-hydroxy-3-cyclohexene-1-carboxylate synthase
MPSSYALARLARAAGWPLLADAASGVRRGPQVEKAPVLGAHEAVLRAERFAAAHAPELVLRFGPPPTSRAANLWLERHAQAELRLVDPDAGFADPTHRAAEILCVDPALLCTALADEIERGGAPSPGAWLADFLCAEERAQRALAEGIARERTLFSPAVARALASALPRGGALFASNSMAIRDVDGFLGPSPAPLRVLANRGANGIDGITSSALGAALGTGAPLACLIGDLAFLHDVGGLVAAKRHRISCLFAVLNDDGGGIFSHLPVARFGAQVCFEELFAVPHGIDLSHASALGGGRHVRVSSLAELERELARGLGSGGLNVVEIRSGARRTRRTARCGARPGQPSRTGRA